MKLEQHSVFEELKRSFTIISAHQQYLIQTLFFLHIQTFFPNC